MHVLGHVFQAGLHTIMNTMAYLEKEIGETKQEKLVAEITTRRNEGEGNGCGGETVADSADATRFKKGTVLLALFGVFIYLPLVIRNIALI